jgi:hypothetical protein
MSFLFIAFLAIQSVSVVHVRTFQHDVAGTMEFTDATIVYRSADGKDSHSWTYPDVKFFDRVSPTEFVIGTYEDSGRLLGRDRRYRFRLSGDNRFSDALFDSVRQRLGKPVINRVVPAAVESEYEIPVKHLHALGGCEGVLRFTPDGRVFYVTADAEDAREWRLGEDIQSIWSTNNWQLEIHVYEDERREFSRKRIYRFELKERLNDAYYRKLKLKLFDLTP